MPALDVLRALAIVLVTNSHLDAIYPDARASTGGAFGNALFFFVSGYGLALGIGPSTAFGGWMMRRLVRIYLPLWTIVGLVAWIAPAHVARHGMPWAQTLLWPTWYWFVSAIVLFYPAFFVLARLSAVRGFVLVAAALVPLYAWLYLGGLDLGADSLEAGRFKWIFYAQVMLMGGWFARQPVRPLPRPGLWLFAGTVGFVAFKLAAPTLGLMAWQWVLHVAVATFTVSLFFVVSAWCERPSGERWKPAATFVGSFAFEVYLVQELFHHDPRLIGLGFPFSFVAFWLLCLTSAWLLFQLHRTGRRVLLAWWRDGGSSGKAPAGGKP
jgi:peptidoglycan/LPS O-acetylase OafA/YrhL